MQRTIADRVTVAFRACAAAGAAALAACAPTPRGSDSPTILLVVLDTVRADRLSLYGYDQPTSPQLERLAERSTVFHRARSTAPWTLPSHASMFTGLYPAEHGARAYAAGPDRPAEEGRALDLQAITLAEVLRDEGYRTGAIVANHIFLAERYQLDQGFDHYAVERAMAPEINDRALAWLDEDEGPAFLFLNYMDAHRPYQCAPREGFPDCGTPKESSQLIGKLRRILHEDGVEPDPTLLQRAGQQYDNALANLDAALGELLDALESRGLLDEMVVVVTSDHGEFLGERAFIGHGMDVYREVLGIPLVVKGSGQDGRVDDRSWISLVHVPGMILEHAGVDAPDAEGFRRHWPRTAIVAEDYPRQRKDRTDPRFLRTRRAVFEADLKYIESSDGAHELYDVGRDPLERENLYSKERSSALDRLLAPIRAATGRVEGKAVELSEEDRAAMRALGYGD